MVEAYLILFQTLFFSSFNNMKVDTSKNRLAETYDSTRLKFLFKFWRSPTVQTTIFPISRDILPRINLHTTLHYRFAIAIHPPAKGLVKFAYELFAIFSIASLMLL